MALIMYLFVLQCAINILIMRLVICENVDYVAEWSAKYVLKKINDFKPDENKYFVMGLPTGT